MSEQIDIAVDLGAVPPPLPEILNLRQVVETSVSFQHSAVDLGKTNTFTVSVTGDAPLAFQWRRDDMDLPNQTNRSVVIAGAQMADEGDYRVIVTNAFGAVTSSHARLWVVPPASNFIKGNFTNATRRMPYFYLKPADYDPARSLWVGPGPARPR